MNKALLSLIKHKEKMHRRWEQGHPSWNEYKEVVRVTRNVTRKAKARLQLNMAKDLMDNKKCFLKYKSIAKGKPGKIWAH